MTSSRGHGERPSLFFGVVEGPGGAEGAGRRCLEKNRWTPELLEIELTKMTKTLPESLEEEWLSNLDGSKNAIGPKIPQVFFSPKNSGDSVVILLWSSEIHWLHRCTRRLEIFCFFLHFEVHRSYLVSQIFFSQQVWLMSEDLCWLMKGCSILDCWIVCLDTKCPGIAILSCICHIQLFTNSSPTDSWGTFWH